MATSAATLAKAIQSASARMKMAVFPQSLLGGAKSEASDASLNTLYPSGLSVKTELGCFGQCVWSDGVSTELFASPHVDLAELSHYFNGIKYPMNISPITREPEAGRYGTVS